MAVSFDQCMRNYRYNHFSRKGKLIRMMFIVLIAWTIYDMIFRFVYPHFKLRLCEKAQSVNINALHDFSKTEFVWPEHLSFEEIRLILDGAILPARRQYSGFEYPATITPKRKCNDAFNRRSVDVLFLIKSAPDHFQHRIAIRKSWGDENTYQNIRRIFLVGSNRKINEKLKNEGIYFDDILQINFIDTYFNNTLKLTNGLLWASKWCQSKYVVMVDDDYFVATYRLLRYLDGLPGTSRERLYFGQRISGCSALAIKSPFNKWYISYKEYPYENYPQFITAGTIVMSSDTVRDMVKLFPYTKQIMFDDVYLGFIAHKLNISAVNTDLISTEKITPADSSFDAVLTTHGYRPEELMQLRTRR